MTQGQTKTRLWVEHHLTGPMIHTEWVNLCWLPNKSLKAMSKEEVLMRIGRPAKAAASGEIIPP